MDRLGFGDPPPDPYADLPFLTRRKAPRTFACPRIRRRCAAGSFRNRPQRYSHARGTHAHSCLGAQIGRLRKHERVAKLTDKYVEIADTGTYFTSGEDVKGSPGTDSRDVCVEDLQTAHGLRTGFGDNGPRTSPGTTTISVSQAVFNDLKTRGKTDFRYLEWWKVPDMQHGEGYLHWDGGVMTRVEPGDVSFPVIVNGTPTTFLRFTPRARWWLRTKGPAR